MAKEIERKFLVKGVTKSTEWALLDQAYLLRKPWTVRVRTSHHVDGVKSGYLTIKSKSKGGISRDEYEWKIPFFLAKAIIALCSDRIEKARQYIWHEDHLWEVDLFLGENDGLCIAEIELSSETEEFSKPEWLGDEVTFDKRYANSYLVKHPYKDW
jgi:adenylate cyclase